MENVPYMFFPLTLQLLFNLKFSAFRAGSEGSASTSGSANLKFDTRGDMKILYLGARRSEDVEFLIAVYILRWHIILLLATRPSDVEPNGFLDAYQPKRCSYIICAKNGRLAR